MRSDPAALQPPPLLFILSLFMHTVSVVLSGLDRVNQLTSSPIKYVLTITLRIYELRTINNNKNTNTFTVTNKCVQSALTGSNKTHTRGARNKT